METTAAAIKPGMTSETGLRAMTAYTIVGFDPDSYVEPVPTSIDTYWSRTGRYYITVLLDEDGLEIESATDGTKADRDVSVRLMQRKIEEARR